jgi:hypothetical protein
LPLWATFQYRDFYDVPRQLVVRHRGRTFLLDCRFDEARDEYDDEYEVFEFPDLAPDLIRDSPDLRRFASELLGRVEVGAVRFDTTLRSKVDLGSVPPILAAI